MSDETVQPEEGATLEYPVGSPEWKESALEVIEAKDDAIEEAYAEAREQLAEDREDVSNHYESGIKGVQQRIDRLERELDRTEHEDVKQTLSEQIEGLRQDRGSLEDDYERAREILAEREDVMRERFELDQLEIEQGRKVVEEFDHQDALDGTLDLDEEIVEKIAQANEAITAREQALAEVEEIYPPYEEQLQAIHDEKIALSDKYLRDRREVTKDIDRAEKRIERSDDPAERRQLQDYIENRKDDLQDRREDYNNAWSELEERRQEVLDEFEEKVPVISSAINLEDLPNISPFEEGDILPEVYDVNYAENSYGMDDFKEDLGQVGVSIMAAASTGAGIVADGYDAIMESGLIPEHPIDAAWQNVASWGETLEELAPALTDSEPAMLLAAAMRDISESDALQVLQDAIDNAADNFSVDDIKITPQTFTV